jgi:electron transfer flavoprotein alpha subunit
MPNNVWVLAEEWRGEVSEGTFELLALGRELADGLGVSLEAVLLGSRTGAEALAAADGVVVVPAPADASGDAGAELLAALMAEREPAVVLTALSNVSWDIVGLLPARAGVGLVSNCRDAAVVDGAIEARCILYGGKMEVTVRPATPAVIGVLAGARTADAGKAEGSPPIEEAAVGPAPERVRFVRYVDPEAGDVDVTQQDVLVAVGRGIGTDAEVELAEELAEALGGAVCGSRPVIDQGWLSLNRQIGKSGVTVRPRLYIAAGISGAPEHTEGMKDSDLIVAINTDPDAPIFDVAHYGVHGDAADVIEALAEAIAERKG